MPSVIIVDDLQSERLTLRALCHSLGAQACCAATTTEAARLLGTHRPKAAIVDLVMPGADGFDCLFMIAKLLPEICVAVTTASESLLLKAAAELADGYGLKRVVLLPKPIGIDCLREFLADAGALQIPASRAMAPMDAR